VAALVKPGPGVAERVVDEQVRLGFVSSVSDDDPVKRIVHLRILAGAVADSRAARIPNPEIGGRDPDEVEVQNADVKRQDCGPEQPGQLSRSALCLLTLALSCVFRDDYVGFRGVTPGVTNSLTRPNSVAIMQYGSVFRFAAPAGASLYQKMRATVGASGLTRCPAACWMGRSLLPRTIPPLKR